MSRNTASIVLALSVWEASAFAEPIRDATLPEISRYYEETVDALLSPGNPFLWRYKPLAFDICWSQRTFSPQQIQEQGMRKGHIHYYPSVTFVYAQFHFQVTDTIPPKLIQMSDCLLSRHLLTNGVSHMPVLTTSQVIARAERYCDTIGCPVQATMKCVRSRFMKRDGTAG